MLYNFIKYKWGLDMKEKNIFKNFIEDEFSMSYFNSIDSNLRLNLTLINCWCSTLVEASDEECNAEFRENIANNIIKACCGMLRPNDIVSKIIEANRDYRIRKNLLELSGFFMEFCNNCNARMGKKCTIKAKKSDKMYVNVSEKFLVSILLIYVRQAVLNKAKKIDISCTDELGIVMISMKMKISNNEEIMLGDTDCDYLYEYSYEIASFFTEKMNGAIEIKKDEIIIKFPSISENAFHERTESALNTNVFNMYNLLLSDINDFDYY